MQCFAGEGLAIHFTNNAEGVLSKRMNPNISKNLGIDNDSMNYLNHHFEETYYEFKQTITKIRNHEIKTIDEINNLIFGYWLDCYIEGQNHEETPYLKQSRLYSLGNELWGVIYDVYGMDGLYEIVNNPKMFVDKFNVALQKINKKELCI